MTDSCYMITLGERALGEMYPNFQVYIRHSDNLKFHYVKNVLALTKLYNCAVIHTGRRLDTVPT